MSNTPWCVGPSGPTTPGAVQEHRHRQVLERDFLEDLVVAPLQERAVDIDDRPQPGLGHAGRHGDRVRFANADVEEAVGELVADRLEHVALAHGGGDHDRPRAFAAHLLQAAYRGRPPCRAASALVLKAIEPLLLENGAGVWNETGSSAAGSKPWPFSVTTCSSTGPLTCLAMARYVLQLADAVAVDRPVVIEAEFLEEHAAHQPGLDGVFDLVQEALHRVADDRHADDHLLHFGLDAGIKRVHADAIERFGQAARRAGRSTSCCRSARRSASSSGRRHGSGPPARCPN